MSGSEEKEPRHFSIWDKSERENGMESENGTCTQTMPSVPATSCKGKKGVRRDSESCFFKAVQPGLRRGFREVGMGTWDSGHRKWRWSWNPRALSRNRRGGGSEGKRRGGTWNWVCYDRIRGDRRCTVVRRVKRRGGKIPTRIRKYSLGGCGPEWAKSIWEVEQEVQREGQGQKVKKAWTEGICDYLHCDGRSYWGPIKYCNWEFLFLATGTYFPVNIVAIQCENNK